MVNHLSVRLVQRSRKCLFFVQPNAVQTVRPDGIDVYVYVFVRGVTNGLFVRCIRSGHPFAQRFDVGFGNYGLRKRLGGNRDEKNKQQKIFHKLKLTVV